MINPETIKLCRESLNSTVERLNDWLEKNPLIVSESEKDYKKGEGLGLDGRLVRGQNHKASKALLEDCQVALKRMDDGTYGICGRCGNEISEDRLVARPEVGNCKPCQEKVGLRVH